MLKNIFKGVWKSDVKRTGFFMLASVVLLAIDKWLPAATGEAVLSPVLNVAAIGALVACMVHLVRKVLHPYFDMRMMMDRAACTPTGSALVVLGMFIFLATVFFSLTGLLR